MNGQASPQASQGQSRTLAEYRANHLIFVYEGSEGAVWGEWDIPSNLLPRHKTAEAKRSPAPPAAELAAFHAAGSESRRKKNFEGDDYLRISENLESLPKSYETSENISENFLKPPHGGGSGGEVGRGDGKVVEKSPSRRARASANHSGARARPSSATLGVNTRTIEEINADYDREPSNENDRKQAIARWKRAKQKSPKEYEIAPQWAKDAISYEATKTNASSS